MSLGSRTTITAALATTPALPTTSRRRLLAGSGLAAAFAAVGFPTAAAQSPALFFPVTSPDHLDAGLIAACAMFFEIEKTMYALGDSHPYEEHDEALERYHDAYSAVESIRPRSLIGLKAKARVMMSGFEMCVACGNGDTVEDRAEWHELGVWRLLHDVLALGGVA